MPRLGRYMKLLAYKGNSVNYGADMEFFCTVGDRAMERSTGRGPRTSANLKVLSREVLLNHVLLGNPL
jgi:hypothetical protein